MGGLTTWENAPHGKIVKPDVSIAKNYLKTVELEDMGCLVNAECKISALATMMQTGKKKIGRLVL